MHEWHTDKSTNIQNLIDKFIGYDYNSSNGNETISDVSITNRTFDNETAARNYVTECSYGSNTAYIATITNQKTTKAYQKAFSNYLDRRKDYVDFHKHLNIGTGRKSSKVTCPECNSSINLKFGSRFKYCPVCKSTKIISDSNWNMLETKKRLMRKAAETLNNEALKCGVTFICGFEWHC